MDERPEELRRQRELIAAHLRWLDEQITRSTGTTPPPAVSPTPIPAQPAPQAGPAVVSARAASESEALAGFSMPEVDPTSIRNEVRRGCMIYVIAVSLLLLASLGFAWWVAAQD